MRYKKINIYTLAVNNIKQGQSPIEAWANAEKFAGVFCNLDAKTFIKLGQVASQSK